MLPRLDVTGLYRVPLKLAAQAYSVAASFELMRPFDAAEAGCAGDNPPAASAPW